MVTYSWNVRALTKDADGNVQQVKWEKVATNSETGKTASFRGTTEVELGPVEDHVEYENLTETDVLGWVQDIVAPKTTKINAQLTEKLGLGGQVLAGNLPWND